MDHANRAEREGIEVAIRSAFAGVQLGSGTSLQQARLINDYAELSEAEFAAIPRLEITDDWTRLSDDELVCDALAHLDGDGLRYYLPALMLWLLDHYNEKELAWRDPDAVGTEIGTIHALAPDADFAGYLWEIYDTFTPEQRTAMATYVDALPRLVELDYEDSTRVGRAMDSYWSRFLPEAST